MFWALIGTNRDESAFLGRRVSVSKSGLSRRERDGWQVCPLLQGSRLAATAVYRYRFFILVFRSARLPKLASAISSSRAWVTGRRNRQCGRSSICSDSDDVCHCEGKCAERGMSSGKGCRLTFVPTADRLCFGIRTVRDTDLKTSRTHSW